jgi:hypothetical protein
LIVATEHHQITCIRIDNRKSIHSNTLQGWQLSAATMTSKVPATYFSRLCS